MTVDTDRPRECPKCRVLNEPGTSVCDCGYDFTTGRKGTPRTVFRGTPMPPTEADFGAIEYTALAYRRLIALVGINVVVGGSSRILHNLVLRDETLELFVAVASLVVVATLGVLSAHAAYRVAAALGASAPVIYAVACLLPCIAVVALLALSARATAWAKRNGLEVGLLGPKLESLDALRQARRK
jgi:hypothetical protein